MARKRSTLTPLQIKIKRDMIHTARTITDKQIARMKSGRKESTPDEYSVRSSAEDISRRHARKVLEDRALELELRKATESYL